MMISARDLIRVLRFPLLEVSDWISLARASQLENGALAEVSLYLAGGSCEVSHSSIHPSAWNRNSANFALTEFSEVRACQTRISGNAWRYPTLDCEDLLTCHYQNIKQLKSQ